MEQLRQALREAADPTLLMRRVAEQAVQLIPHADGASLEVRVDDNTLEYLVAVGTLEPYVGCDSRSTPACRAWPYSPARSLAPVTLPTIHGRISRRSCGPG